MLGYKGYYVVFKYTTKKKFLTKEGKTLHTKASL